MITFSIPQELVTPEDLVVLTCIEEELKAFVKHLLNQKKSQIKVAVQFELVEKKDEAYFCESNSSFSIPDSIDIALKIKEYLAKQSAELEVCLKKYSLKVSTSFRMPEGSDAEKKDSKDSKEEVLQFLPVRPKYNFSQIILSDKIREEVYSALKVIECKDLVYNTWGFAECDPVPRSVLNLYGEPGTGKTMCAHAIANRLNKTLLALNYAEIESKYVGEAPKNLQLAFDIAKKTDSVLFFDEADVVFCPCSEVESLVVQQLRPHLLSAVVESRAEVVVRRLAHRRATAIAYLLGYRVIVVLPHIASSFSRVSRSTSSTGVTAVLTCRTGTPIDCHRWAAIIACLCFFKMRSKRRLPSPYLPLERPQRRSQMVLGSA